MYHILLYVLYVYMFRRHNLLYLHQFKTKLGSKNNLIKKNIIRPSTPLSTQMRIHMFKFSNSYFNKFKTPRVS